MKKNRLDIELVNRGLAESRTKAQTLIRAGLVMINQQKAVTPSQIVDETTDILITQPLKYVSRGGLKLEHALQEFEINPNGYTCLDIGASTGGFTDCLLQHGATKIYAVDVGRGQLAQKLRQDQRVINMEKTHWQTITELPAKIDLVTIDVSFISLTRILTHLKSIAPQPLTLIALLKPQFEAGPQNLKKGVVKDPKVHETVINDFTEFCRLNQFKALGQTTSPIKGPKGNIEFLFHLKSNY